MIIKEFANTVSAYALQTCKAFKQCAPTFGHGGDHAGMRIYTWNIDQLINPAEMADKIAARFDEHLLGPGDLLYPGDCGPPLEPLARFKSPQIRVIGETLVTPCFEYQERNPIASGSTTEWGGVRTVYVLASQIWISEK